MGVICMINALIVDCPDVIIRQIAEMADKLGGVAEKCECVTCPENCQLTEKNCDVVFVYAHGKNAEKIVATVLRKKPIFMQLVLIDGVDAEALKVPGVDAVLSEPLQDNDLKVVFEECYSMTRLIEGVKLLEKKVEAVEKGMGI
jgi:hypothetical protein